MKKIRFHLLLSLSILLSVNLFSQYSIPVSIATDFFWTEDVNDEWIHLKITDTINEMVVYDNLATVYVTGGIREKYI